MVALPDQSLRPMTSDDDDDDDNNNVFLPQYFQFSLLLVLQNLYDSH